MKTVSLAMLFAFTLCFVWVVRGTVYIMCILSNIIPKHNRIELQCRQMSFTSFANSARHRLISHIFHNNCANYSDFTVGTPGQRRGKQNLSPVNNNKNNNKIYEEMKPQHPNLSNPIDRSLFVPIPGPKLFPAQKTAICASEQVSFARAPHPSAESKRRKAKVIFFSLNYLLTTGWLLTTGHEAFLPCIFCRLLPPPPFPREDWLDGTFMTYKFPAFALCTILQGFAVYRKRGNRNETESIRPGARSKASFS